MNTFGHVRRWTIVPLVTLLTLAPRGGRAEPAVVSVRLESGRQFTGAVDRESNDAVLWLRSGDAAVNIRRPIAWERVTSATHEGKPLSAAELKALAKTAAAADPAPAPREISFRGVFPTPTEVARDAGVARFDYREIRSLSSATTAANFDADADVDGLEIEVSPRDSRGALTATSGLLEVELLAPQVRTFNEAPQGRGLTLERIGAWTIAVSAADFQDGAARVQVPFQQFNPASDVRILPYGVVRVTLSVPGHGVFEARENVVRLRPWAPLQDGQRLNRYR